MRKAAENRKVKQGDFGRIFLNDRCTHMLETGKRCRQKAWRGKAVCYQHDPQMAELRRTAGRPRDPSSLVSVVGVQEALAETLEELRAGKLKPGEAYAAGYRAQLALTALTVEMKVSKLDVKHFWEMVDLGATTEKAVELQKQREKEKEAQRAKEAEEAEEAGEAEEGAGEAEEDDSEGGSVVR